MQILPRRYSLLQPQHQLHRLIPTHLLPTYTNTLQQRLFSSASSSSSSSSPSPSPKPTPAPPASLTHLTASGAAHMVSISSKQASARSARATTTLRFSRPDTLAALTAATLKKGDAIAVARIAGITAAKKTADLIPLAHPGLAITGVEVDIVPFEEGGEEEEDKKEHSHGGVRITATVQCEGKTGVEMEALTAAMVAGLTMYDMLKGVDRGMSLEGGRVVAKSGGRSGAWRWDEEKAAVVKE